MKFFLKLIIFIILMLFLYKELHPKIIINYADRGDKTSITVIDENGGKKYLRKQRSVYYVPWNWNEDSLGLIFVGRNFTEIFFKEDIDFCTLKIFLDENQNIKKMESKDGFCIKYF